ncbi:MAG: hypothetical protein PGN34_17560 [Methylobacterium frigidaeris]
MTRWRKTAAVRTALGVAVCAALAGGAGSGAATGRLVGSAQAREPQVHEDRILLDDVTLDFGGVALKAPKVEILGSPLSQAEWRTLLAAGGEPWPERLRRLDARTITMPVLRVEQTTDQGLQVEVYRDVVARDVVQGRIGTIDSPGAVLTVESPKSPAGTGTYGKVSTRDLDLVALARLLTETGGADAPSLRVVGAFEVQDIAFTDREVSARIAGVAGRDLGGRPTATPWGETARRLGAAGPDEQERLPGLAADLFGALVIGQAEMRDLALIQTAAEGPTRIDLARLTLDGGTSAPVATAEGFRFDGPTGRIGLKRVTLSEISLTPTLDALRRPEVPGEVDLRRYLPLIGRVEVSELDIDLPNETSGPAAPGKDPAPAADRMRFGLRKATLDSKAPRGGVPTALRLALDGFAFTVPPGSAAPVLSELGALGYQSVDLSGVLDSRWDEATREVSVRELVLTGRDMGTARLSASFGGIGQDVFNHNPTIASLALLGASARNLALTVENGGLFERFVAGQARAQSLKPAELQQEYGTAAMLGIPAVLGNSAGAKALGQAVARFVARPGRLSVTASAKDPAGLGLLEASAAGSPGKVFDRLNVTATAE